jgi:hypothetical protein
VEDDDGAGGEILFDEPADDDRKRGGGQGWSVLVPLALVRFQGCHDPSTPQAAHTDRAQEKAACCGRDDRERSGKAFFSG